MKSILIVDDEKEVCRALKGILTDEGYTVYVAHKPENALLQLETKIPSLVLLDVWFGKSSWDGVHFLDQLKRMYPFIPIIMMSGHANVELAVKAIRKGAYNFIEKPIDVDKLLIAIERAIDAFVLQKKTTYYKRVWPLPPDNKIKKMAQTEHSVLIVGEPGMDYERLAFHIHQNSVWRDGPFISTSAALLNKEEKEHILGNESNHSLRLGLLDDAQCGTLLIRNIHDLNAQEHALWLNIFSRKSYLRLEGKNQVPTNFRLMFTAHPDFLAHPTHYKFPKELYAYLTAHTYTLPPLREKKQDIDTWIYTLLREIAHDFGEEVRLLSPQALRILQQYTWPKNVWEMKNVLERAFLHSSVMIDVNDLSIYDKKKNNHDNLFVTFDLHDARLCFESEYLHYHMVAEKGNITAVAKKIGVDRSALYRKLHILAKSDAIQQYRNKRK